MRHLRILILLLLSLALPVYGYSGLGQPASVCPMQQEMGAHGKSIQTTSANQQTDCCDEMETFANTGKGGNSGKVCKTGQDCQNGGLALEFALHARDFPEASGLPAQFVYIFRSGSNLAYIWRPPSTS